MYAYHSSVTLLFSGQYIRCGKTVQRHESPSLRAGGHFCCRSWLASDCGGDWSRGLLRDKRGKPWRGESKIKGACHRQPGTDCLLGGYSGKPKQKSPDFSGLSVWVTGGEGGIRTHVGLASSTDFESGPFGLSGTSPLISELRIIESSSLLVKHMAIFLPGPMNFMMVGNNHLYDVVKACRFG